MSEQRTSRPAVAGSSGSVAGQHPTGWTDSDLEPPPVVPLTRAQAADWRSRHPQLSPWRVVVVQVLVGAVAAALAGWWSGRVSVWASVLYGAAVIAVPSALMARGMTSPLTSLAPTLSFVSVLGWEAVKLVVALTMLWLAPKVVQPLEWPALLAGLVVCSLVYGFALRWRVRKGA